MTAATGSPRSRAPGRRRDEGLSRAIVDATLAILREEGYDGLTIEAIARRAGVSRPAIYARWRTLHDLVLEAARQARSNGPVFEGIIDVPDTGTLHGDLLAMMRASVALHRRMDERGILNGFVAGIVADPSLGPVFRASFMDPDFHRLMVIFERARARGELRDDADPRTGLELLVGCGFYRSVITRDALDDEWLERAIDLVVAGVAKQS
jgi:AcrR family transcriptional regulator